MDLLTPAHKWAATDQAGGQIDDDAIAHAMPWPQRAIMLVSVAGPLVGLAIAVRLLWSDQHTGWNIGWPEFLVAVMMYALAGFGVTIGYHRLLTHRSFQTRRPVRLLLAVLGSSAGQGMVIRWCAAHRRHHQRADREGDPHSPHQYGEGPGALFRGFWHAHMGWVFKADEPGLARSVPDLLADRGLLWVDQLYFVWVAAGLLAPAVALGLLLHSWHGFLAGLIWGGLVRICLMQHVTWSVNSVCHIWGGRPFQSHDHSTNNLPVAILSLGEGWHNNHHAFPTSARHGLRRWQIDPSYLVILLMKGVGLAWSIRIPTEEALSAKIRRH